MNTKQKTAFSIVGIILSFVLFVVGMLYAEKIPLLVIVGVLGIGGIWYFVFHIVGAMKNRN